MAEFGRQDGISVTGGYVYRGKRFPELRGKYFYGDYFSGNLWSLDVDAEEPEAELVRRTGKSISSFGQDDDGELYVLSFDGGIYRIVPSDRPADDFADWPKLLSETGLFESVAAHQLAEHVVPYDINVPFWSDGADKLRFFALPEGSAFGYREYDLWEVPVGTTLGKSFRGDRDLRHETRLIQRTEHGWEAATYVWNRQQRDAVLAPEGQQFEVVRNQRLVSWHAPSASECSSCHLEASGFVLGLRTAQLHRPLDDGVSQIVRWAERGLLDLPQDFDGEKAPVFPDPTGRADLEDRARTWLDVNCAMCHQPEGPGNALIDLRYETPLEQTALFTEPGQGHLGIRDARIVAPGDPERSLLWYRVQTLGEGRMPNIASNLRDEQGSRLLQEWIAQLE